MCQLSSKVFDINTYTLLSLAVLCCSRAPVKVYLTSKSLAAVGKYKNKKGQIFRAIATGGSGALVKWAVFLTKDNRQVAS